MRAFIFITDEGYTFQPGSESELPDVENLQVLGFAVGVDEKDAFQNLLREDRWLIKTKFDRVQCIELKYEDYQRHSTYFSIEEYLGHYQANEDD